MAHEIESMFYTGETPWHQLGVALPSAPSTREAIVAAGLDWDRRAQVACHQRRRARRPSRDVTGRGNQLPGVRGTMWAAYNAITEYLAYGRGDDGASRLNESWFGSGAVLNARALRVGTEMSLAA